MILINLTRLSLMFSDKVIADDRSSAFEKPNAQEIASLQAYLRLDGASEFRKHAFIFDHSSQTGPLDSESRPSSRP